MLAPWRVGCATWRSGGRIAHLVILAVIIALARKEAERETIADYAGLGLKVSITELDVTIHGASGGQFRRRRGGHRLGFQGWAPTPCCPRRQARGTGPDGPRWCRYTAARWAC